MVLAISIGLQSRWARAWWGQSPGPAMSGTRSYEPWQYAARKGVLLRKNPKRGFLESAYKDKYMCWLSRDTLHLRAAEVVTFRSNQGAATHDKIVVADEEESFPLDVWVLVDDSKDFKDGKFSLKNKDGTTLSLRCEDENATMRAQQAQGWADDLKAILERMTGGPKDGAAGDAPTKGAPEKEPSGSNSAGGPDLGSANAGRGAPKKEDTQPNRPHAPAGTDGRGGGSDKAAQKLHGSDLAFEYENGDTYRGDWSHGKKHGRGRYVRADGTVRVWGGRLWWSVSVGQAFCPSWSVYMVKTLHT